MSKTFSGAGIQLACGQLGSQRTLARLLEFYAIEEGIWEDWSFCPGTSFAERLQLRFDEDVWSELGRSRNNHPARRPGIKAGETKRKAELKHISLVCSGSGNVQIPSYPMSSGEDRWWTSNDAECLSSPFIGGVRVRMHKGRIGLGVGEWGQGIETVTGVGPAEYRTAINSLAILCWQDMTEEAIKKYSISDFPPLPSGKWQIKPGLWSTCEK